MDINIYFIFKNFRIWKSRCLMVNLLCRAKDGLGVVVSTCRKANYSAASDASNMEGGLKRAVHAIWRSGSTTVQDFRPDCFDPRAMFDSKLFMAGPNPVASTLNPSSMYAQMYYPRWAATSGCLLVERFFSFFLFGLWYWFVKLPSGFTSCLYYTSTRRSEFYQWFLAMGIASCFMVDEWPGPITTRRVPRCFKFRPSWLVYGSIWI